MSSNDISNFLSEKQNKIKNQRLLKEKTLIACGDVITNFSNQGKNTQSEQEKRNKAIALLFTGSSAVVLGQVLGIDIFPDQMSQTVSSLTGVDIFSSIESKLSSFSGFLSDEGLKTTINNVMTDTTRFATSSLTENSSEFKKDMVRLLLEMNYYLDPNKINYSNILSGIATVGAVTTAMYTKDVFSSKYYEDKIANYVDKDLPKSERASFAKNANQHIKSTATLESWFVKIPLFKKPALLVANLLNECYKHMISPKDTAFKAWANVNIGINTIKAVFADPVNKTRLDRLNATLKSERNSLHVNNYSNAKKKVAESDYFKNLKNEGADNSVSMREIILKASNTAYEDILKVNVKHALAKSLFVLGEPENNKKARKEKVKALNILNEISKLHTRTKDNSFDHYAILSEIATEKLHDFSLRRMTAFPAYNTIDDTRKTINELQEEKLNQTCHLKNGSVDYNKCIVDKLTYSQAFSDVGVDNQIEKYEKIETTVNEKCDQDRNNKYKRINP